MERSKANGYRIDSSASEYLADAFNNNLKRINTELEKIFLYSGEKKSIDSDTVQLVAGNPKVESIFDLTESIGEKSIDNSLGKGGKPIVPWRSASSDPRDDYTAIPVNLASQGTIQKKGLPD
tara:strand:+ start:185 stop:550 length:366 start_codon:yes stop_codon:yes gene_type:complete